MIEIPRGVGGLIAFVLGGCVGSFINLVAYRLPREISIIRPRSFCTECGRPIPFWANIPILAYISLRGRCLMCGAPIPFRHPLAELTMAACALYLYLTFPLPDAVARFVFCSALFICALIDYDWRVIPNLITFSGIPVGLLSAWLAIPEVGWKSSLVGIASGMALLFVTGQVYFLVRRREGVGIGDVYLLGMVGAFTGWVGVLFTLFVGSLLGAIGGIAIALTGNSRAASPETPLGTTWQSATVNRPQGAIVEAAHDVVIETPEFVSNPARQAGPVEAEPSILHTEVPFGPYIALAASIFALFQPQLTGWYLSR